MENKRKETERGTNKARTSAKDSSRKRWSERTSEGVIEDFQLYLTRYLILEEKEAKRERREATERQKGENDSEERGAVQGIGNR